MLIETDLDELSDEEFDQLIDNYIERSSHGYNEMPMQIFFELLFENLAQPAQETIDVKLGINNGELDLRLPPGDEEAPILTRGNQILVGDQLIVVNLENTG